jgi:hypothetical protein
MHRRGWWRLVAAVLAPAGVDGGFERAIAMARTHQCRATQPRKPSIAQHQETRQTCWLSVELRAVRSGEWQSFLMLKRVAICVCASGSEWCKFYITRTPNGSGEVHKLGVHDNEIQKCQMEISTPSTCMSAEFSVGARLARYTCYRARGGIIHRQ